MVAQSPGFPWEDSLSPKNLRLIGNSKLLLQNQYPHSWDDERICLLRKNWTWHTRKKADFHLSKCERFQINSWRGAGLMCGQCFHREAFRASPYVSTATPVLPSHKSPAWDAAHWPEEWIFHYWSSHHCKLRWKCKDPPFPSPSLSMLTLPKLWAARVGT